MKVPREGRRTFWGDVLRPVTVLLLCVCSWGLTGCDRVLIPLSPAAEQDQVAIFTVSPESMVTEFSEATATVLVVDPGQETGTADLSDCWRAAAGNPLDVSIPDGTLLNPGEEFSKIWRIKNSGTCTWTREVSIRWFSGEALGIVPETSLGREVFPGDSLEITVDMAAPSSPGIYQSNWKLCTTDNFCFGLGPEGAYPFWARIQVRQLATPTIPPESSPTPASVIYNAGVANLLIEDQFDLDNGESNPQDGADISYLQGEQGGFILPLASAKIVVFGEGAPTEDQCRNLLYFDDQISLQTLEPSTALCYKSTQGLPGYLNVIQKDTERSRITIEYTTWYTP